MLEIFLNKIQDKRVMFYIWVIFFITGLFFYSYENSDEKIKRVIADYDNQKQEIIKTASGETVEIKEEKIQLEKQLIVSNFKYNLYVRCIDYNIASKWTVEKPIDCNEALQRQIDIIENWRVNWDWDAQSAQPILTEWETNRMNDLLHLYGRSDDVQNKRWERVGEKYKIKPPVLVCIAKADSSLWQALKTKNNFGNVWNNDRWNRVHFNSPIEWISAIGKVLNNKYLWSYTKINELSRYGNSNWAIYASSTSNWHNNVINCLSQIYEKELPDDFEFRIN